jgi:2-phosphosulfolactate phosphatase
MTREVKVHLLPVLFEPEEVRGGVAVIIDVLRASTTIVHALANGAEAVVPVGEVDEAQRVAAGFSRGKVLLGGERAGLLIDGFDLDNNPFAYSREAVEGKTIVFTTSNGTRALIRAAQADRVLIGSFVNLQAVVNVFSGDTRPIHLVCAGTMGKITAEDSLCAGAIIDRLLPATDDSDANWFDDQLRLALGFYRREAASPESFREAMRSSYGGRNCLRLGFDDQLKRAATCDLFNIVPEYNRSTNSIRLPSSC